MIRVNIFFYVESYNGNFNLYGNNRNEKFMIF